MVELFEETNGQPNLEKLIGYTYRVYGEHPDTISRLTWHLASKIWPCYMLYTRYLAQENIGDTIAGCTILFPDTVEIDTAGFIWGDFYVVDTEEAGSVPRLLRMPRNKNQIVWGSQGAAMRFTKTEVQVSYRDWTKENDPESYPDLNNSLTPLRLINYPLSYKPSSNAPSYHQHWHSK